MPKLYTVSKGTVNDYLSHTASD